MSRAKCSRGPERWSIRRARANAASVAAAAGLDVPRRRNRQARQPGAGAGAGGDGRERGGGGLSVLQHDVARRPGGGHSGAAEIAGMVQIAAAAINRTGSDQKP